MMARPMMRRSGISGSRKDDQQCQSQNRTHRIFSDGQYGMTPTVPASWAENTGTAPADRWGAGCNCPLSMMYVRVTAAQAISSFTIAHIGVLLIK